jgi:octaprenyl-diphosphate synthase
MDVLSRVVAEMSCGEALEFQYAYDLDVTQTQYEELIRHKTGSLIGAATEIGAAHGAADDATLRARWRRFGDLVGVAFQIVDDLFDYQGDPEVTGKPVGSDLAEGKVTLPLIAALRAATDSDRRALKRLALRKRWTPGQWEQLGALVEKCGGFAAARTRAYEVADEARALLASAPVALPGGRAASRRNGAPPAPDAAARAARRALELAVDYSILRES